MHRGTERLDEAGHHGRALTAVDVRVVDRVARDDLVVVARRVDGHHDARHVADPLRCDLAAQGVDPLGVVDDLLG